MSAVTHVRSVLCVLALTLACSYPCTAAEALTPDWDAAQKLGMRALNDRNWKRALAYFEKAQTVAEGFPADDPRHAQTLTRMSKAYKELRRFDEARAAAKAALVHLESTLGPQDPALVDALNASAEVEWRQSRHAAAEPYLRRVLALRGHDDSVSVWHRSQAYARVAEILRYQKKFPESLELYRRSVEVTMEDPSNDTRQAIGTRWGAHLNAAGGFKDAGDYAGATEMLKRALEYEKTLRGQASVGTRVKFAEVAALAGRIEEAVAALEDVLRSLDEQDPASPQARTAANDKMITLLALAQIFERQADHPQVEIYYARTVETMRNGLFGFDRIAALYQWKRADAIARQGRHEEAARLYDEAEPVLRAGGGGIPQRVQAPRKVASRVPERTGEGSTESSEAGWLKRLLEYLRGLF